jgi:hypothetical protein
MRFPRPSTGAQQYTRSASAPRAASSPAQQLECWRVRVWMEATFSVVVTPVVRVTVVVVQLPICEFAGRPSCPTTLGGITGN